MTGRGRGRGLAKAAEAAKNPGGLKTPSPVPTEPTTGSKPTKDNTLTPTPATTTTPTPSEDVSTTPSSPKGSASAMLSVEDIQTILQDSRTYSDSYDVKKVLMLAQNFVRTEKDVKSVACAVYQKCMEDSSLAKRGAEICDSLTAIEVGSLKFRNCLLSLVQADYKIRKDIKSASPTHFNGFLAFLCEIFNTMRTASGEVFKPLVPPIFDCFSLVLGGSAEEGGEEEEGFVDSKDINGLDDDACDIFALHLQFIGRLLEQHEGERMRSLMNRVRTCIIHSKCSPRARCCLLEVLEANARSWEEAPNDTTKFYCDMAVDIISGLVL